MPVKGIEKGTEANPVPDDPDKKDDGRRAPAGGRRERSAPWRMITSLRRAFTSAAESTKLRRASSSRYAHSSELAGIWS